MVQIIARKECPRHSFQRDVSRLTLGQFFGRRERTIDVVDLRPKRGDETEHPGAFSTVDDAVGLSRQVVDAAGGEGVVRLDLHLRQIHELVTASISVLNLQSRGDRCFEIAGLALNSADHGEHPIVLQGVFNLEHGADCRCVLARIFLFSDGPPNLFLGKIFARQAGIFRGGF
ncbi:MAG: hypothetical protein IIB67_02280 [Proteobacteria bacterium]|nr:hypothetical protein [Pseudomonadota bacterium]